MEQSSHNRLRAWLGLPPGPWPPDHYALLGLARGIGEIGDIEGRVLDRMELLRPYQLLHPEAVTEGMNCLARALVCLTDPVARAAYDRSLGIPPPPFEVVEDEPLAAQIDAPTEVSFEPGLRPPSEPQRPAYEVVWEPELDPLPYDRVPLPYEVVPDEPKAEPLPLPPAYEVVPDTAEPELPPAEALPVELPPAPTSRRGVYRRLAALRRALRAWEQLRPVLGNPAEALATPVSVLLFLQALAEARAALPGVANGIGRPGEPGGTILAIVRLPHALAVVRTLLPAQRRAVAIDWRRGYDALRRERDRMRELAVTARPPRRGSFRSRLIRAVRRTPEWVLIGAVAAAILVALFRRNS